MSTTTNFKRVALVAVAALGLGVLSTVPSSAAVSAVTTTVVNGATTLRASSDTLVDVDTGLASGASIIVSALITDATDSITVAFYNKNTAAATGNPRLVFIDTQTSNLSRVSKAGVATHSAATKVNGAVAATGFDSATATTAGYFGLNSSSGTGLVGARFAIILDTATATAGAGTNTYTVVVTTRTVNGGQTQTNEYATDVSIVIAAGTAASLVPSATTSTFFAGPSTGTKTAEAALTPCTSTASAVVCATFTLALKNAASGATAQDTVTATTTGGNISDGTSTGKSIVKFQTGSGNWTIVPDGTAGPVTVTFKTTITGLTFTRTVNFYAAKAATITASNFSPVLKVGDNTLAVAVTAKDASGNAWTGTAYIYASSAADALIASSGSATPVQCAAWNSTTGIICPVTGTLAGTAKLKVIDAATVATANATSNEITVSVKPTTAASVKIAFDKATYAPGEKALVTVTPVAADGTNLPATTVTNALAAGGIKSSVQLGSSSASMESVTITTSAYSSATSNLVAGAMTYVVYMPTVGGAVTLTATGDTGLPLAGQVAITAKATVTDSGAAALAAVTALATTVASLKTLITTLTNLVLKIQKKVKA